MSLPNIKNRLLSGFGFAGLFFAVFFLAPDGYLPFALAGLAAVIALEFYQMTSAAGIPNFDRCGTGAVVLLVAVTWASGVLQGEEAEGTWDAVAIFLVTAGVFLRQFPQKNNPTPLRTIGGTLFGVLYVGLLWNFLTKLVLFGRPEGVAWLWTLEGIWWPGRWLLMYTLFASKFTDVGAYLTGCSIGKHKLCPRISPKKTWEGVAGGVLFSTLLGTLLVWAVNRWGDPAQHGVAQFGLTTWRAVPLGLALGGCAVLGDLTESLFKRASGLKDSASVLPGMGGLLDVLDSVLFTAPAMYLFVRLAGLFGLGA